MNDKQHRRRGPKPGNATVKCTFMLDPETHQWAVDQPNGLSGTLRSLLQIARRNEYFWQVSALGNPLNAPLTPEAQELLVHFSLSSEGDKRSLLLTAEAMHGKADLQIAVANLEAELKRKTDEMEAIHAGIHGQPVT